MFGISRAEFDKLSAQVENLVEKLHTLDKQHASSDSGATVKVKRIERDIAELKATLAAIPALKEQLHKMDIRLQAVEKVATSVFASVKQLKEFIVQGDPSQNGDGKGFFDSPAPYMDEVAAAQQRALDEHERGDGAQTTQVASEQ